MPVEPPPNAPYRASLVPLVAGFPSGSFAFVMASGIVSIAAMMLGLSWIAIFLLVLNLTAFPVLLVMMSVRLIYHPAAVLADLCDYKQGPSFLTIVAGTSVLGNQIWLLTASPAIAAGLWIGACALWVGLIYCPFVLTIKPMKPPLDSGLDGSWLLIVVATEALSISGTHAAEMTSHPEPIVFASLCLFALGSVFYLLLLMLIVYRWLFWPMSRDQLTPSYWINMGAAAITTLAGARLLPLLGGDPALAPIRGFVAGEMVMFWSLATWWIPLLVVLTIWRRSTGAISFGYRLDNWSIVFPLGMYTAASWNFSQAIRLPFLAIIPEILVWVAIVAWCITFVGMIGHLGRLSRSYCAAISARPRGWP
jgi:tellurite resistance protein TehA-like permease